MLFYGVFVFASFTIGCVFSRKRNLIIGILLAINMALVSSKMPFYVSDYTTYEADYNNQLQSMEPAYNLMTRIFFHNGFSYENFRIFLIFFFFGIMFIGIYRLKINSALFFSIYSVFPFFVDAIQVRILGFVSFFVLAISLYDKSNSKKRILLIEATLIIGANFHSIGYIFVLFPLMKYILDRFGFKFVVLCIFVVNIVFGMIFKIFGSSGFLGNMASFISSISGRDSMETLLTSYYSESASTVWTMIWWIVMLFSYAVVLLIILREKKNNFNSNILGIGGSLMLIASFSIPLIVISGTYSRIYRIGYVVMIMIVLEYFAKSADKQKYKITLAIMFFVSFIGSAYLIYLGNVATQIPLFFN